MFDKPNSATLAQSKQLFIGAGLPLPPTPMEFAKQLQPVKEWVFSTRFDTPNPYAMDWYVREYLENGVSEDYLIFGHDGHGLNSYAMHYYLVRGPLAIFDQLAWGGIYNTNSLSVELMAAHFAQIQDLIETLDTALVRGLLDPDERFIVVLSDFSSSRWVRARVPLVSHLDWQQEANGLLTLLSAVIEAQQIVEL